MIEILVESETFMNIKNLIQDLDCQIIQGNTDTSITELIYDTRKITPGSMFVCIQGSTLDSHDLIPEIIEKGSTAIVVDRLIPEFDALLGEHDVTIINVTDSRKALALISCAYFDYPAKKLTLIGITGTKGKTTISYMMQAILEASGAKVGVIGTIGAVIDKVKQKTANTTPESYELQRLFHEMVLVGCTHCVMEVSSQGLKMHRVAGITFDIGIFTNFSADHIGPNEHATMEEYLYCKSLLFQQSRVGIVNMDDTHYEGMIQDHTCELKTFGQNKDADLVAQNLTLNNENGVLGIRYQVSGLLEETVTLSMPGNFSVYNSLAALLAGVSLGIKTEILLQVLSTLQVRGRVEIIPVSKDYTVMIDYAHNEVSVESILTTIKEYAPKRIVCVYGGGGNRSKLRRYSMGELCGKMADLSVLTCDNPRTEEVSAINEDIKVGLARSNGNYLEIEDRKEAILYCLTHAQKGDVIVLLGKGHEEYQEIKGQKYHFSEKEIVEEYAASLKKQ